MLDAGNGEHPTWTASPPGPGHEDGRPAAEAQEDRGRQIVEALQARARAQGRDPLGEAEQRTVLETVTNLPADVIDRVVAPSGTVAQPTRSVRAARPWEQDFPVSISDVVASAGSATQPAAQSPAAAPAQAGPGVGLTGPRP
jgi:hypothetical protein